MRVVQNDFETLKTVDNFVIPRVVNAAVFIGPDFPMLEAVRSYWFSEMRENSDYLTSPR
jgi:hypothetical protein